MSKIGSRLDGLSHEFMEFFGEDLQITNYRVVETQTAADEWDDPSEKQETTDSPIAATGQVDPISAVAESEPWARDIDADVAIFVDSDVTISDGEEPGLPYPSDVEVVSTGRMFRVVDTFDEGNGLLRCLATSIPRRGE